MKRIIALILAVLCMAATFGCAKKSSLDSADTNEDGSLKELKSETKYNFLVMGHDRAASLTDVIMLVSFDTKAKDMTIMQIPRDTYLEVEDNYYTKANGMYNYFKGVAKDDGSDNSQKDGAVLSAEYLSKTLGIKIHYAAVMDLDGFGDIVDAVGGVYMYVPYTLQYNDPAQNLYINLPEGYNTLDGDESEQFVRYRSGFVNADLGRGDAQKMFMTAFIEAVKNNISISNVDDIADAVFKSVETNMSLADIVKIGTAFIDVELSSITMMTVPGELASSYYVINKACVTDVLNESYNIYADELSAESVDKNGAFVNEDDAKMVAVYEKSAEELDFEKHNAQDVSNEDIYIPLK